MIYKLSDYIHWSNHQDALSCTDADVFICLADNLDTDVPKRINNTTVYNLGWDENKTVTEDYARKFTDVLDATLGPHIAHFFCRAGQMRSPAAAIVAAWWLEEFEHSLLWWVIKARNLRKDILGHSDSPYGIKAYPWSLFVEIAKLYGQEIEDPIRYGVNA